MTWVYPSNSSSLSLFILKIITWHSISMSAGLALLQFDGSKAGLSMDLPFTLIWEYTKTGKSILASNFFQDGEDIGQLFMW